MTAAAAITAAALPDTSLVREATAIVGEALPTPILAHSRRVFALGREYGRRKRVEFSEEDLLLAALFHDLGLGSPHPDPRMPFTFVGARALHDFLFLRDRDRADRAASLADAIAFHMQLLPRWSNGPVAGLLQIGAWMDVTGLRAGSVGAAYVRAVRADYPRDGFDEEFSRRLRKSLRSFGACVRMLSPGRRPAY